MLLVILEKMPLMTGITSLGMKAATVTASAEATKAYSIMSCPDSS